MGIATVAVYSEADRAALHIALADEAYEIGPAPPSQSYLNGERLIECARKAGAEAVHPGYGFLAENAAFARSVVAAGLTWIGPHAGAIDAMGDKLRARQAMRDANVPSVPGGHEPIADVAGARAAAEEYGLAAGVQSRRRRRRKRTARGEHRWTRCRRRLKRLAAKRRRISRTIRSMPSTTSRTPSTSNCKCSPTNTATSFTSASATARCSAATRKCGRRLRPVSPAGCARRCARPASARQKRSATILSARSNVSLPETRFTFWR